MPKRAKILIVDDEAAVVQVLKLALEQAGFEPLVARSGEEALEQIAQTPPDLVLLDIMMPGMDGLETLKEIRKVGSFPIIMVTVMNAVEQRVKGLESGADDYLAKPFSKEELLARIRAHLRRRQPAPQAGGGVVVGWVRVDLDREAVHVHDREVYLPGKAWRILRALASRAGEDVPTRELIQAAWRSADYERQDSLKVEISKLRQRLEDTTHPPQLIHTVRGKGYSFDYRPLKKRR